MKAVEDLYIALRHLFPDLALEATTLALFLQLLIAEHRLNLNGV